MSKNDRFIFRQLFESESSTYTYLLADSETREAILIDTVIETVNRDLEAIDQLGLQLKYVLDTHVHADHITGAGEIRKRKPNVKTAVSQEARIECADLHLKDGDLLSIGGFKIKALSTPGHTDGCMSYQMEDRIFTGDALLIRAAGRTDFQQGSAERLYESITQKLFRLSDEVLVYPAHDYQGRTVTTIGEEKKFNLRIGGGKTKEEFIDIMNGLKLSEPKKIRIAVPANLRCGLSENESA